MTLSELCKSKGYTTDKDTTHSYLDSYDRILGPYKNKHVDLLEIGNNGGESIKLWDDYFDSCEITGIEVLDIPQLHELNKRDNINIHQNTDAYSQETFQKFQDKKFDIIIDDGSHLPQHQVFALKYWFTLLKDDGVIIIEDIQNINFAQSIIDHSEQIHVKLYAEIIDLRNNKGRFDDIMIVVRREQ